MQLPYFYEPLLESGQVFYTLSENTSKHCIQVLRMKGGDKLLLTNGNGLLATVTITVAHKSKSQVQIEKEENFDRPTKKTCIAIGLLKNNNRMEWFLEKATELGITEIIPMNTQNTEKTIFKKDRATAILAAAMIQSQQVFIPVLQDLKNYSEVIHQSSYTQKLIAHCEDSSKTYLPTIHIGDNTQLLIGPEGDFSHEEINEAITNGYEPVSLGNNRLRTETAGVTGAVYLTTNQA